ncbi:MULTISPECIES: PrsW family glutamic-type intramembrane protease [Mammaliicoccus]|uniref:PrsW family intramembrane metalloprotease n=1 Tax=Mammaliicoccus lentus TaxID=42858 RepID=A0ABS6H0F3_MAMLE|nr:MULTISPECIES: PrsW family glutamic-type intramembrane protease [Mammaliicoccus]MBU6114397.1 PrsW family intramembrane metalloprotease [Mammaliicoccus lentus]MBW0762605.1 PrsW family intramembrane metalloprotease [Mammaliicoccus lentus]MCD2478561.1 PrsW family glutamic-type intramembrane protease [Mammaliicoccus lentus]MCD2521187.1 PrsW family glutamic-type intramembrane protease [Mammaliicoccus lentus]MEB5686581.1 PrsW family glutamic-type intramembrane protease [Mammaliicoccus lentus]
MICANCSVAVGENDKFCINCGTNLEETSIKSENIIQNENACPMCNTSIEVGDKFCTGCGHNLNGNDNSQKTVFSNIDEEENFIGSEGNKEKKVADNINLKSEAKNIFDSTTKSIGRLAGSEESLNLNLRDMFSEVFKPHTKDESDEVFIAGTKNTTPSLDEVSEEWGKPWVFARVFLAFALVFIALWVLGSFFENEKAIPGLIFIGALTVPLAGLFFFYESNAFKNISLFEVLKMFFIGGVLSLISTTVLYSFITFSDDYYFYGSMTVIDAGLVGLVEETGKALIIVYFVNKYKTNKILNGLLIGGAIGAGFAVFESAGYILTYSTNFEATIIEMVILRAWSAIGGHLVWSAIVGAAIVIAKGDKNFEFNSIMDKRFLFFFLSAVILHGIWDTSFSIGENYFIKYLLLIFVVWLLVFILMKAGLRQVNILQAAMYETKGEKE